MKPSNILSWLFWCLLAAVIVLSLLPIGHPDFSPNDKVNHLLAWASLGVLAGLNWRWQWLPYPVLFGVSIAIEVAQGLTSYRFFSWGDILANGVGLFIGWLLVWGWDRFFAARFMSSGTR